MIWIYYSRYSYVQNIITLLTQTSFHTEGLFLPSTPRIRTRRRFQMHTCSLSCVNFAFSHMHILKELLGCILKQLGNFMMPRSLSYSETCKYTRTGTHTHITDTHTLTDTREHTHTRTHTRTYTNKDVWKSCPGTNSLL